MSFDRAPCLRDRGLRFFSIIDDSEADRSYRTIGSTWYNLATYYDQETHDPSDAGTRGKSRRQVSIRRLR